ncbi:MAG: zinc ribbon domain-containing protein [Rubrivivax sp.]|nr:zinc ribbon domain-containing protein [Rubrivivax sp.]
MSYQWGPNGPAFEYPNCYRTENRVLTLRAAVLLVVALVMMWIALAEPDVPAPTPGAVLRTKLDRGQPEPHVVMALVFIALAIYDLVMVSLQRRVQIAPGQPAPLAGELGQRAKGVSAGAQDLKNAITSGVPMPSKVEGPWRRWLELLAPGVAATPVAVRGFMEERLAHALTAVGLLAALGLTSLIVRQPPALALAALLYAGLAGAMVARSAWIVRGGPGPVAVAVVLLVAFVLATAAGWFAPLLPGIGRLPKLGLTPATVVLLVGWLLLELLGLLAARNRVEPPMRSNLAESEHTEEIQSEPERVMQELERDLHRFWTEGIPNRRHAYQSALGDPATEDGRFTASLLEESQPVMAEPRPGERHARTSVLMLALPVLGLLLTLAGGALWVRLAHVTMENKAEPFTWAATAFVLVMLGGYAVRVVHLLWSRFEVVSTLVSVSCKGARDGGRGVRLRMRVVHARSSFYAGGEHVVGSRTLINLVGDSGDAKRSVQQVKVYAERAPVDEPGRPAAVPRPVVPAAPSQSPSPGLAAPRMARFCANCGQPLALGARFCQGCGTPVS